MLTVSKEVQIVDSDERDGFSVSEESINRTITGKKRRRKAPVKRAAGKVTRRPTKKQKP